MLKVYRLRRIISATLWFGALSCQSQQVTDHLERRTALQSSVTDSETTPLAVGNLGNGWNSRSRPIKRDILTADEITRFAALKPQGHPQSAALVTPTEETVQWATRKDPNEGNDADGTPSERSFPWQDLRQASGDTRDAIIRAREADLAPAQASVVARLNAMGAEIVGTRWLANAIDIRIPAKLALQIASMTDVLYVEHGMPLIQSGTPGDGSYGGDRRTAVHAERLSTADTKDPRARPYSVASPCVSDRS